MHVSEEPAEYPIGSTVLDLNVGRLFTQDFHVLCFVSCGDPRTFSGTEFARMYGCFRESISVHVCPMFVVFFRVGAQTTTLWRGKQPRWLIMKWCLHDHRISISLPLCPGEHSDRKVECCLTAAVRCIFVFPSIHSFNYLCFSIYNRWLREPQNLVWKQYSYC